jgi:hypothetical protein
VQEVLGFDASQHFPDQRPNPVLQHYNGELSDAALKKFLGGLADHHLAILIQSTAEYPFDQYAATVRQSWGTSGQ